MQLFVLDYVSQACAVHPLVLAGVVDVWPAALQCISLHGAAGSVFHQCLSMVLRALCVEHAEPHWAKARLRCNITHHIS